LFSLYKQLIERASERARSFDKSKLEKKARGRSSCCYCCYCCCCNRVIIMQQGTKSTAAVAR
jgi:hypothetical protein